MYKFCMLSGGVGPKRVEGDFQVPEGLYHISYFNPYSNFYLSMKVSYPNRSDLILGNKSRPGGDIYIHGNCVSIGCIPITDDKIKELYVLAMWAKDAGQSKIPVYLFPFRMTEKKTTMFCKANNEHKEFWENLKVGYNKFNSNYKALSYTINSEGKYIFSD